MDIDRVTSLREKAQMELVASLLTHLGDQDPAHLSFLCSDAPLTLPLALPHSMCRVCRGIGGHLARCDLQSGPPGVPLELEASSELLGAPGDLPIGMVLALGYLKLHHALKLRLVSIHVKRQVVGLLTRPNLQDTCRWFFKPLIDTRWFKAIEQQVFPPPDTASFQAFLLLCKMQRDLVESWTIKTVSPCRMTSGEPEFYNPDECLWKTWSNFPEIGKTAYLPQGGPIWRQCAWCGCLGELEAIGYSRAGIYGHGNRPQFTNVSPHQGYQVSCATEFRCNNCGKYTQARLHSTAGPQAAEPLSLFDELTQMPPVELVSFLEELFKVAPKLATRFKKKNNGTARATTGMEKTNR